MFKKKDPEDLKIPQGRLVIKSNLGLEQLNYHVYVINERSSFTSKDFRRRRNALTSI